MPSEAQNNVYNIPDYLYAMMTRAGNNLHNDKSLQIADSMWNAAVKENDGLSCCLSRMLPLRHYIAVGNLPKARESYETLKFVSRQNSQLYYYYLAYAMYAGALLDVGKVDEASKIEFEMGEDLQKDNYPYGNTLLLMLRGDIYMSRNLQYLAESQYKKAYAEHKAHVKDHLPVLIEINLGDVLAALRRYDEAMEYYKQVLTYVITEANAIKIKYKIASLYYKMGEYDAFLKSYNEIIDSKFLDADDLRVLRYDKAMIDGEYQKALSYAKPNTLEDTDAYLKLEDYKSAYNSMKHFFNNKQRVIDGAVHTEMFKYTEMLENEMLKTQVATRRLATQMSDQRNLLAQKENAKLMNENVKINHQAEQKKKEATYTRMQQIRLAEKEDSMMVENSKMEKEMEENHSRETLRLFLIVLSVFIVIIIWLSLNAYLRRRDENKIRLALKKANETNRMKSVFIQNMSHEIRTPLNAICGFAQVLGDSDLMEMLSDEERDEFSNAIDTNTALLTIVFEDVLNIGDIDSGKYHMNFVDSEVDKVCQNAVNDTRRFLQPGVSLTYNSALPEGFTMHTDERRIEQIVKKLVQNACKFTEQGSITVNSKIEGSNFVLTVEDTGPGIPADKKEVIFDRFEKLDSFKQGVGLGLTIARTVAGLLNGKVYLDTDYTDGARFVVELPIKS